MTATVASLRSSRRCRTPVVAAAMGGLLAVAGFVLFTGGVYRIPGIRGLEESLALLLCGIAVPAWVNCRGRRYRSMVRTMVRTMAAVAITLIVAIPIGLKGLYPALLAFLAPMGLPNLDHSAYWLGVIALCMIVSILLVTGRGATARSRLLLAAAVALVLVILTGLELFLAARDHTGDIDLLWRVIDARRWPEEFDADVRFGWAGIVALRSLVYVPVIWGGVTCAFCCTVDRGPGTDRKATD